MPVSDGDEKEIFLLSPAPVSKAMADGAVLYV